MTRFRLTGVTYTRRAETDIADTFEWYDAQSSGAGAAFLRAVDAAIEHISQFPEASPVVYGDVRSFVMNVFPYTIYYTVRRTRARVIAVVHHRRDTRDWPSRAR